MLLPLLFVALVVAEGGNSARYYYKSTKQEDFLIGALFPIHRPPYTTEDTSRSCGEIWELPGIQRFEAALQTVDDINSRPDLLPNSTLGIQVRDSCQYTAIALEQVSHMIRRSAWSKIEYREEPHPYHRPPPQEDLMRAARCEDTTPEKNMVALVGPLLEGGAIDVHSLMSLFKIPVVGYAFDGLQPDLSSTQSYYVSVAPSNESTQARAMADLVTYFNWTYVSTVFTNDVANEAALAEFMVVSKDRGVCIAQFLALSSSATNTEYYEAIANLQKYESSRVVVCFCTSVTVVRLLSAIRDTNITGRFTLLVSESWMADMELLTGFEEQVAGSLAFRNHAEPDDVFKAYYTSLNPGNNVRNPWFPEFWETKFQCSLGRQGGTAGKYERECTGKESLSDGYEQDTQIDGVKSAIYLVARALHNMLQDYCQTSIDKNCYRHIHVNGDQFFEYLEDASPVYQRSIPELNKERSATPWYDVVNFVKSEDGKYGIKTVASWSDDQLTVLKTPEWNAQGSTEVPVSECGRPCPLGHVKVHESITNPCCWKCVQCADNQYVVDDYLCAQCKQGTWPNENMDGCDSIPQKYAQWTETASIIVLVISVLSIANTVCTTAIFIRYAHSPIVKTTSRALSFLVLAGVLLSEAGTFAVVSKPSVTSCLLERLCPVLGVATVYAAIFAKTYRLCRVLSLAEKQGFPAAVSARVVSSGTQLAIAGGLVALQFFTTAAMLAFQRPGTVQIYPAPNRSLLICDSTDLAHFLPWGYNFLLMALCTVCAFKARNLQTSLNEAKMVGFAMYATAIIWVAYVAVYAGSENNRKLSLCLAISASSQVLVALLFLTRIYALLSEPVKNACCSVLGARPEAASTVSIVQELGREGPRSSSGSLESLAQDKIK
ncbi:metabotropic glutamate receptor 1-like [Dermacentor variabilis]|uniref:metabotropic glutamate receptor 1-like n=1 Tax=Dermacentor variabilis TaxID=34621 RepID=UPI003F5C040A